MGGTNGPAWNLLRMSEVSYFHWQKEGGHDRKNFVVVVVVAISSWKQFLKDPWDTRVL